MGEIPEITKADVDAAHRVMEKIAQLRDYAEQNPDDALDYQRLDLLYKYVEGFHSTLAMLYAAKQQ